MVLQVLAAAIIILAARKEYLKPLGNLLLVLVVISALVSAVQYFLKFWSQVDGSLKQRKRLRLMEAAKKTQDVPTV
jgi:phosphatidylglycerophosphate synthase